MERGKFMIHRKYDDEYIAYINRGESAAVFIIRDVCKSIDTTNFWIDITNMSAHKNNNNVWEFDFIDCEMFPRITRPDYSKCRNDEDKKYVTWETAQSDISIHKKRGYEGAKYKIVPILYNANKGKFHSVKVLWNNTFRCVVPEKWRTSSCEYKIIRKSVKPDWKYSIKSVRGL